MGVPISVLRKGGKGGTFSALVLGRFSPRNPRIGVFLVKQMVIKFLRIGGILISVS